MEYITEINGWYKMASSDAAAQQLIVPSKFRFCTSNFLNATSHSGVNISVSSLAVLAVSTVSSDRTCFSSVFAVNFLCQSNFALALRPFLMTRSAYVFYQKKLYWFILMTYSLYKKPVVSASEKIPVQ